jgi:hypothetical protein
MSPGSRTALREPGGRVVELGEAVTMLGENVAELEDPRSARSGSASSSLGRPSRRPVKMSPSSRRPLSELGENVAQLEDGV